MACAAALWTTVGFAAGRGAAHSVGHRTENDLLEISHTLEQAMEVDKLALGANRKAGDVKNEQDYVTINGLRVPKGGRNHRERCYVPCFQERRVSSFPVILCRGSCAFIHQAADLLLGLC